MPLSAVCSEPARLTVNVTHAHASSVPLHWPSPLSLVGSCIYLCAVSASDQFSICQMSQQFGTSDFFITFYSGWSQWILYYTVQPASASTSSFRAHVSRAAAAASIAAPALILLVTVTSFVAACTHDCCTAITPIGTRVLVLQWMLKVPVGIMSVLCPAVSYATCAASAFGSTAHVA